MERVIWASPVDATDYAVAVARRFVRERFGDMASPRSVRFLPDSQHFTFHGSAWVYRLDGPTEGQWRVMHTGRPSPRGAAYQQARRDARLPSQQPRDPG